MKIRMLLGAMCVIAVSGCQQKTEVAAVPSPFILTASIQDLMQSTVDASSDPIWESVSIVSSEKGTQMNQPKSDAEWKELRHRAITLIEATNLLVMEGRKVVNDGGKIEGEGNEGSLSAAQVQALIDGDRASFVTYAHGLHDSAVSALNAIDKKDANALLEVGGVIDAACEACHKKFWYPDPPAAK
jgi:hypothetical protein